MSKCISDRFILPKALDRRVKLNSAIEDEIKALRKQGLSMRNIEKIVPVSRRTIQFVLFPERRKIVAEQFKERRKDGRYSQKKDGWASIMREHRDYKKSVLKESPELITNKTK